MQRLFQLGRDAFCWRGAVLLSFAVLASGCRDADERPGLTAGSRGDWVRPGPGDACATPNEGCECAAEGDVVDCGQLRETYDEYVTCSRGSRSCVEGRWGACVGDRVVQTPVATESGSGLMNLGSSAACPPGYDPCDPFCHQVVDSPAGLDAGTGFSTDPTQLTLSKTVQAGCGSLSIAASSTTATVTQIAPIALAGGAITLTAALTPSTCLSAPFATTWTIDRFDVARVTGTNNTDGSFSVVSPYATTVTVTAYAAGLSATRTIRVKVNALETPATNTVAAPNLAASGTQLSAFGSWSAPNAGSTASTASWLYPYAKTYFPLGLLAPVAQYLYSGAGTAGAVKVSLRYPANSSIAASDFNYSIVVKENNVVSQSAGVTATGNDPQVVIPQVAWQAFEQTARGNDASLHVQRYRGSAGPLEIEKALSIHLVNGQLKGTVFYNSYSSPQGGDTGAVLSIAPGASAPTLAVQPSGRCTVCHSLNLDGTRLIANGRRPSGGVTFNNSQRFDLGTSAPSPTVLNNYDAPSTSDVENISGDRFTFGAPWLDGTLYVTHGGRASYGGDANWRAPPDYSRLYNVANPTTALSVTGFSNVSAVTPRFSIDGKKLAFGFWGGTALAQAPSGTLAADATGKTLVVADFGCSTANCTPASTGFRVSNARNVTPGLAEKVGWPWFTPDGTAVLYQRQYKSAKLLLSWSPSDINTVAGALAEIWMSDVPANKTTAATPTRLNALNGLNADGTSYLPQAARTFSPPIAYHADNATFTINQADSCARTAVVTGVSNYRLNYLPAVAPTAAGDYHWVVFTSRRMYGNVAFDDPWDAEPGYTCNSRTPPTKKLWVAAVNKQFTPGTDPSHPAFYLPGQELEAGNSNGYWVSSQCAPVGAVCATNDDCCGGTGSAPTERCDAVSKTCKSATSCVASGGGCDSSDDCCTGLVCDGSSTCKSPSFFGRQTFQREYVASCPSGESPVWRHFEWQASIASGTSIDVAVQTRAGLANSYTPASPLALTSIVRSTSGTTFEHAAQTVDQALRGVQQSSLGYLLVTLTFNPNTAGTLAPALSNWRQTYDCIDSE